MIERVLALICLVLISTDVWGADLYRNNGWSSLASDRNAYMIGDILTVVVYENAKASNSVTSASKKAIRAGGRISADASLDHSLDLGMDSASDNAGSTGRSGGMVAQISATVDDLLPNGDLHISGEQVLNINGEKTLIRVSGNARRADISGNTILSSRLAEVTIDYDGSGFVSRSAKPGIVTRLFNWLGLI